jgi:lambda family phage holin
MKNDNFLTILADTMDSYPLLEGVVMAIALAFLRLKVDKKRNGWKLDTIEVLSCACIAFAVSPVITWLGMPENVNIATGAAIGVIGSKQVQFFLLRFIGKRVSKE